MKVLVILLCALVLTGTTLGAQTVTADRVRLNTGQCLIMSGSGTPEGVVTAPVCSTFFDTGSGQTYEKWTGTGTTGWRVGFNTNAQINGNVVITGNEAISGLIGNPGFVSQLTDWRITALGAADFRYVYTDELHAKAFIADLEQALAGGQLICKSVTTVGAAFTNPAGGGTATLTVKDLPSAADQAVFQSGDWVGLRTFSRAGGGLIIGNTFGIVTSYADQADGLQTWTYTRGSGADGGALSTSIVVAVDAIVIDYGTSGNGCAETNAIDGANAVNSPYAQTWYWSGSSPINANRHIMTRTGKLDGITTNTNEFGIFAGVATGTPSLEHYIVMSNDGAKLYGTDLFMYDGSNNNVIRLNASVPSLAIGPVVPTAYATGEGFWCGMDSGVFKCRMGNPAAQYLSWDGTTLFIDGRLSVGTGRNLITNSDCRATSEGWSAATSSTGGGVLTQPSLAFAPWILNSGNNAGTCYINLNDNPVGGVTDVYHNPGTRFPVIAGNRYEYSVYVGDHRFPTVNTYIVWYDTTGTIISLSAAGSTCVDGGGYGGTDLIGYCRTGVIATAPTGATTGYPLIRMTHYGTGTCPTAPGCSPYLFWSHAYFGEASQSQTRLTEWGPAGSTLITPGLIQVNSITTTHLAFTPATSTNVIATINASAEGIDITADRISISGTTTFSAGYDPSTKCPTASCIANGGAAADVNANTTVITGGKITVNGSSTFGSGYDPTGKIPLTGAAADVNANVTTIDGGHITTNSITASQIAANTITASQIAAGAITATEISVSSLDAISANMGTIMAGSIYLVGSYGSITIDGNSGGIYGDVVGAQSLYVSSAQITSLIVPGLGGGNGYVCVGSSGNLYRATSCP